MIYNFFLDLEKFSRIYQFLYFPENAPLLLWDGCIGLLCMLGGVGDGRVRTWEGVGRALHWVDVGMVLGGCWEDIVIP